MKFGKRLQQQIEETLPGWRRQFLSYKALKKLVRAISAAQPAALDGSPAESTFISRLNSEIEKFNAFFMEQEEDFIIRHRELHHRIQTVVNNKGPYHIEEMMNIRKDTIDFHGEMILLINYSNLNYTGLAKILKKYDKRTGGQLRPPFIKKVLQQPFFTTDLVSKLVKECESTINTIFPVSEETITMGLGQEKVPLRGESIFRNNVAALLNMQEIRKGSSTYSHFSLPPLTLTDFDLIQSLQLPPLIAIP
ncbi:unnamed protein product [Cuscuta epithymum]|uniref:SPX domain-containing protein n=1 Tax=Cuscuta epithymum TaxID=186058 RepID=A0AAV0DUR2_9ASTE|nr:unnamed protein product [Cuscuta epithymum]